MLDFDKNAYSCKQKSFPLGRSAVRLSGFASEWMSGLSFVRFDWWAFALMWDSQHVR